MYQDRYDNCLEEVAEICKPIKEKLYKCLCLENNYNIDKYTIYKEMVEMELFNYFCELMEQTKWQNNNLCKTTSNKKSS